MSDKGPLAPVEVIQPTAHPGEAGEKRERAVRVIAEILRLMGLSARLDAKDAPDGGISVAVEMEGEMIVAPAGKRSHVVDALQFLTNKIVNRPGAERRWISIGIGSHPDPRPLGPRRPPPPAPVAVPPVARPPAQATSHANGRARVPPPRGSAEPDESKLEIAEDTLLSDAVRTLAQNAGALGRFYAIVAATREDRARILKAGTGIPSVKIVAEGDGRNRRVVFVPDKPSPMPKKTLPADDEAED